MDQNKQLKFSDGSKTVVTIKSMGIESLDFGEKYVVHIEETNGFDHFMPSDGLQRKITELNAGPGDKIVIEKVAKSDKYTYGYFNVEMAQNQPTTVDPAVAESPVGTGFAQKDVKAENQDRKAQHDIMWKWYQTETGDEELPF